MNSLGRQLLLLLLLAVEQAPACAQRTWALETLAAMMEGSYTSAEQAKSDTSYYEIELEMKRIWGKRKDGAWFYVEQAAVETKDKPYRQRVYHVQEVNDSTFTSDILTIRGGATFVGAYRDPAKQDALRPDSLDRLDGCTITLHRRGNAYVGGTQGNACANQRAGATYATSEVSLVGDRMVSWDRGYDASDQQVWGAEKGGYVFVKRKRY